MYPLRGIQRFATHQRPYEQQQTISTVHRSIGESPSGVADHHDAGRIGFLRARTTNAASVLAKRLGMPTTKMSALFRYLLDKCLASQVFVLNTPNWEDCVQVQSVGHGELELAEEMLLT